MLSLIEPWFGLEADFEEEVFCSWTEKSFVWIVFLVLVYVALAHEGKTFMRDHPGFDLRTPSILWSGSMAVVNILGSLKSVSELMNILQTQGWRASLCDPWLYHGPIRFWPCVFIILKIVELGDTAFVVLRKQPLPFSHWFHDANICVLFP